MPEAPIEQSLHSQLDQIKAKIVTLIKSGKLEKTDAQNLENRLGETLQAFEETPLNPPKIETRMATLEVYLARLETPVPLSKEQESKALTASSWMLWLSIAFWLFLMISNFLSILLLAEYSWPFGWFTSYKFVGFTLAGVTINILISLVPRVERGDWDRKYLGTYAFRVLQATIYSAVIFHFVRDLPATTQDCPVVEGAVSNCLSRENFPFEITGIFVGMFVNLLEGAFAGIGERFIDMISTLFSQKFAGPRQKAEKNNDLRQKLVQLTSKYTEMDKSHFSTAQRESMEEVFKDTLLLLQSNENDRAEARLQELELKMAGGPVQSTAEVISPVQPTAEFISPVKSTTELISIEPNKGTIWMEEIETTLKGHGFQEKAAVKLQKDQETIDATNVAVLSETQIRCTFSLKNRNVGKWNVVVINPNSKEIDLQEGFEIAGAAG